MCIESFCLALFLKRVTQRERERERDSSHSFVFVDINVGDYAKSCRDVFRKSIRIWVLLKTENGVVNCSSCHLKKLKKILMLELGLLLRQLCPQTQY